MRRPRRSEPIPLSRVVPRLLGELGLGGTALVVRIADRWEEIAGPEVARHCQPTALRGKVLEATAESSVWCQELQLRRTELLGRLQAAFGDEAPAELWFRVG